MHSRAMASRRSAVQDWRPVWETMLALVISAIVLWTGLIAYYSLPRHYARLANKTYLGASLRLDLGEMKTLGTDLVVTVPGGGRRLALLLPVAELQAAAFAAVRIRLSGAPTQPLRWYFAWRRSPEDPRHEVPLRPADELGWALDLKSQPSWHDRVGSIALIVEGTQGESVQLADVTLLAKRPTAGRIVRWILDGWLEPEGWSGYSINGVVGGGAAELPLLPSVALWLVVACALLLGMALLGRHGLHMGSVVALALAGWLVVDLRWQLDLLRQLGSTRAQFAGLYHMDRREAADDTEIFQLAQLVRDRLPSRPVRIFLLTPGTTGDDQYRRLRLNYYLLPHNVMSDDTTLPDSRYLRRGDYVLLLGAVTAVHFDAQVQALYWGADEWVSAMRLAMRVPGLRLYRVR